MHPLRRQRLVIVLLIVLAASSAVGLILFAVSENLNLFFSPQQIAAGEAPTNKRIRAGGMVREGSVKRASDSLKVEFVVTDYKADVTVVYEGILPDLFAEGEGVVATGHLDDNGIFQAEEVLAKHDENYMPPEVNAALEEAGHKPVQHNKGEKSPYASPYDKHNAESGAAEAK